MKRACFFGILISLLIVFCGCDRLSQRYENNLSTNVPITNNASASETVTRTSEQALADFKALEPQDIRSIDIVVVRNTGTVERVTKAFTDTADIQKILSVFAAADAEITEEQKPSGGWSVMVRIWLQEQKKTDIDKPILVSPQAPGYISIDNYVYSVKNDEYITALTSFFEASPIQEKSYP